MMAPQLLISTYSEQFGPPGRVKPAEPRPTSAHRRNKPHPRLDFLLPRSLQSSYRSPKTILHSTPPVDVGRPLFPPVRNLSFHTLPASLPVNKLDITLNAVDTGKPNYMPLGNPPTIHALPSADGLKKLQLDKSAVINGHFQISFRNPPRPFRTDFQRNAHPSSAQQKRQLSATHPQMKLQTEHHLPQTQYRRPHSTSVLDSRGGYSCFHVVKPYQAGHFIIHPEFVSECLH